MSTFSLTKGSAAALGMLTSQAGSETLLLTQPSSHLRAELSIEPFTSASGDQLLAELFLREQRHSMTIQRNDSANAQHLADWVEAVANGTLDTALAVPQRTEPAPAQDERELPDYLNEAIDNLVHDNYERSQAGSRNRQADADLIRAALATRPAQPEQSGLVEAQSKAVIDVLAERRRQVEDEQFDDSHDDMATGGQLGAAAACYALWAGGINPGNWSQFWPWDHSWLKHGGQRRMLVKSGALILAEIERIDRAALASAPTA